MAGYLFTLSNEASLQETIRKGRYSTLMAPGWSSSTWGTFGDYLTMRSGDSVYFFSNRKVYGIGCIECIVPGCPVLEVYDGATSKGRVTGSLSGSVHLIERSSGDDDKVCRWLIAFTPSPFFFQKGIDMDDLLSSNPKAFRSLRVFEQRSFIKLDDEEDLAFRTTILRRNLEALRHPTEDNCFGYEYLTEHSRICEIAKTRDASPKVRELMAANRKRGGALQSEAALEAAILYQLNEGDSGTISVFGEWDYLSHQVVASPPKPIKYVDRIDVFGYRWIDGYGQDHIIEKYLVAELKKDVVRGEDLHQMMKYVDWVRAEYANGDYSLISAYLVGSDFDMDSIKSTIHTTLRYSLISYRPPVHHQWDDITLVKYNVGPDGHATFEKVDIGTA